MARTTLDIRLDEIRAGITRLGVLAETALEQALQAVQSSDQVLYHMIRHDLMTMLSDTHAIPALRQDALIMQRVTYWLWIAHNLERVGDHCTNICERIVFFLEGERAISPAEDA